MTQLLNIGLPTSRQPEKVGTPGPVGEAAAAPQSGATFEEQFRLNIAALSGVQDGKESGKETGKESGKGDAQESGKLLPVSAAVTLDGHATLQRLPGGTAVMLGEEQPTEQSLKDFAVQQGMDAGALAVLFARYPGQAVLLKTAASEAATAAASATSTAAAAAATSIAAEATAAATTTATSTAATTAATTSIAAEATAAATTAAATTAAATTAAATTAAATTAAATTAAATTAAATTAAATTAAATTAAATTAAVTTTAAATTAATAATAANNAATAVTSLPNMLLPESTAGVMTATNPLTTGNVVSGGAQPVQNALPGLPGLPGSSLGQAALTAPIQISGQIAGQVAAQDAQASSLTTPLTKPGAEAAPAVAAQMTSLATPPRFLAQQGALADSQKAATPSAAALSKLAANAIEPGGELGIKRDAALMPAREPGVVVAAALANAGVVGPKSMQNKVGLSQPVMSGAAFALSAAHVTDSLALQPSVPRASEMASTALTPPPAGAVLLEDLPDKLSQMVAQRLMANIRGGAWRFDLQLHPQELGSLDVQLEMRDGRLEAQIATSSAAVKEFLGSQLHRLNESLDAAGIKGSSIDVALHQGGHENGAQGRGRGKNEAMSGTEAELHSENLQAAAPAPGTDAGLDLFV